MNIQDLETLARHNTDMVCIVWVDDTYGLIEWKQSNQFNGRHSDLAFNDPDFELLARAFGISGREVCSIEDFAPPLDEALVHKGPAILVVPVDCQENRKHTIRLGDLEFTL